MGTTEEAEETVAADDDGQLNDIAKWMGPIKFNRD
jgi:hypothetical protein